MAARKTAINKWYAMYAQEHIEIDQDEKGLFYQILSEKEENVLYTVRIDDSEDVPIVKSCNCEGHVEYKHNCKHMIIATAYIKKIYRSNLAKLEVKIIEKPVQTSVPAVDLAKVGNLGGTRVYSLLR